MVMVVVGGGGVGGAEAGCGAEYNLMLILFLD